jgi:hypothetical protein
VAAHGDGGERRPAAPIRAAPPPALARAVVEPGTVRLQLVGLKFN